MARLALVPYYSPQCSWCGVFDGHDPKCYVGELIRLRMLRELPQPNFVDGALRTLHGRYAIFDKGEAK